ncbi:MAG TPA: hypothetical protein VFZ80_03190 [Acidimicrobiia bacterium]
MELIALIASVVIGGLFGTASASVEAIGEDVMIVEIEVEVPPGAANVVAHLSFESEDLVLPLTDRGDGVFGIRTELPPRNYFVVFEVIGEEGGSSEAVSLTELGAELTGGPAATATTAPDDEGLDDDSRQMLWLAVALGAASLSALAFWVLGGRDQDDERAEPVEEDEPASADHDE